MAFHTIRLLVSSISTRTKLIRRTWPATTRCVNGSTKPAVSMRMGSEFGLEDKKLRDNKP